MKPWQVYLAVTLALFTDRFFGLVGVIYEPLIHHYSELLVAWIILILITSACCFAAFYAYIRIRIAMK